jgi:hypothetical protein
MLWDQYSAETGFAQGEKFLWSLQSQSRESALGNVEVHVFVDGHGFEARTIERGIEDALLLRRGEAAAEVGFEFFDQQWQAFAAAATVTDGVLHCFLENFAVVEFHVE